ncbi:Uncharacterized protein dnm_043580 [Desulfonema magnum]|uniref:Uncharacterized protein n=1 Tax=Desulfonema magnum TaxID=45655 RepID=A0A975BNT1_9BACT|nr:Uncharacterized protein dnm_043580 [Desulfonema magnum]
MTFLLDSFNINNYITISLNYKFFYGYQKAGELCLEKNI